MKPGLVPGFSLLGIFAFCILRHHSGDMEEPMKTLAIIVASSALAACSPISIKDMRDEPPYKTATFQADYSELGNCVLDKLIESPSSTWEGKLGNLQYESVTVKKSGVMRITGSAVSHFKIPAVDLSFSHKDGGSVVEVRTGGFDGGPRDPWLKYADDAWLYVEECAN